MLRYLPIFVYSTKRLTCKGPIIKYSLLPTPGTLSLISSFLVSVHWYLYSLYMYSSLLSRQSFTPVGEIYMVVDLSLHHIAIESFRLEKPIRSLNLTITYQIHHQIMLLSAVSVHCLNTSRNEDSTNSQDSLFKYQATVSMKKLILTSNLYLHWHDLRCSYLSLEKRD